MQRRVLGDAMAQQLGFFEEGRRLLAGDTRGSIVYHPGLFDLAQSDAYFRTLFETMPWSHETMRMYDKVVDVPRLVAWFGVGAELPPVLQTLRERVERYLGVAFNSMSLNYYRDGNDSVAWHSDHNEELIADPVVALVSFGAMREMQIRTKAVPRTQWRINLEPGSLLTMSGNVQERFEHYVPKTKRPTNARISVALRTKRA